MRACIAVAVILGLMGPAATAAQFLPGVRARQTTPYDGVFSTIPAPHSPSLPAALRPPVSNGSTAGRFLIEATGGAIGSGAGFGLGVLLASGDDCSNEDLTCTLQHLGVALGLSAVGAASGSWLAGRIGDTRPSGWGSVVGGLAGVPAGIGVVHLIAEDLDLVRNETMQAIAYAVTQGLVTALFSRIGAALRD